MLEVTVVYSYLKSDVFQKLPNVCATFEIKCVGHDL